MARVVSPPSENQHGLPLHELVLMLETDRHGGLTEAEAARRLEQFGPNQLPPVATAGPLVRLLRQMHNPLIYVLLAAAVVTFLLGEYVDFSVILGVVVANTLIGFVQESKAEAALDALRSLVHTDARVVRDHHQRTVHSEELVPGDMVVLEAGDKVPADMRVVGESELEVDESALTGESLPVAKDEVVLPEPTSVADRRNMVYSGTFVTGGSGAGVVVATGGDTQLGEIHRLVGSAQSLATPLTRQLAGFSKLLTGVILALAAVTFVVGVARGASAVDMFTAAVALAVGAIPEGLPAAVTVTLAIGVSRMARRRAVVRRLPAVETLGGATVICSDKTGTLTENQMTVRKMWSPAQELRLTGSGYSTQGSVQNHSGAPVAHAEIQAPLALSLLAGANCSEARLTEDGGIVGDPTEAALQVAAVKCGLRPRALERLETIPFSSENQYMATLHPNPHPGPGEGDRMVLVKGGVERVLEQCTRQVAPDGSLEPLDEAAAHAAATRLARDGLRVLATATSTDPPARFEADRFGTLAFTGLQAMLDPPRDTATSAVRNCHDAGIAVKMITGDHAATAHAIAQQVGLLDDGRDGTVLTGRELEELDEEGLAEAAERTTVFARVSPAQKLRLVDALQSRHHVVAMTGDGVNDAPALKQADIGIAMGRSGTEVAKEAGDMVLTDDDFATIEAAVEEGRGVFDNLTKFIVWTLPTNMGEGLVILGAVFAGSTLPILPTQILWINMTTAVVLGLTLAWEPKEPGIMQRGPRDPRQALLTRALALRTLLVSLVLVAGAWGLFEYELANGASVETSRTAAINVFVAVQIFYLLSCRSFTQPVWRVGWFTNRWLVAGVLTQVAGQLALTYLPVMNRIFETGPLDLAAWLRVLAVAVISSLLVAAYKWVLARRS